MAGVAARCEADLCMQLSFIVCGRYTDHLNIICAPGSHKKALKLLKKSKSGPNFLLLFILYLWVPPTNTKYIS